MCLEVIVSPQLANKSVLGKKSQEKGKIVVFFSSLIFLNHVKLNTEHFLHILCKKFCKILILMKKLEFKYDTLQFSMLNPYVEWKFRRSCCDKKFVYLLI